MAVTSLVFVFQDFVENMIHHVATITLMVFSWCNNFVRIGTLVLVIHDAVDYWLEVNQSASSTQQHSCLKRSSCCGVVVDVVGRQVGEIRANAQIL